MRRTTIGLGATVVCVVSWTWGASALTPDDFEAGAASTASAPNFVVILTDDQPFHTLWAMPETNALAAQGVRFRRAFVEMPVCSPPRASFLSGGFHARETGVVWNVAPNGGAQVFNEASTLGTRLQAAGYRTGSFGKWMNDSEDGHVPPGWDRFVHRNYTDGVVTGWGDYRLYTYRDHALDFLDEVAGEPFLLVFSTLLPHYPAIPAPGDESLYEGYAYRERGYGESELSDKPPVVQEQSGRPSMAGWTQEDEDEFHRDQLRSLAAVDRTVGDLIERLDVLGVKDDTFVFFWTDQGLQWGEHGLTQKDYAYEESIRTPLLVWGPDVAPLERFELINAPLDIAATILDLSGAGGPTDGRSLAPLLRNEAPEPAWRDAIFLEFVISPFVWAGVRTARWKYVEWGEGDEELYDLVFDPYELDSRHDRPEYAEVLADLRAVRAAEPRALAFRAPRYRLLPRGYVGVPYEHALPVWGGSAPYAFSLVEGVLPPGLSLADDGVISGTPTEEQPHRESLFDIRVCDSSERRHRGGPQCLTKKFDLAVLPEPCPGIGLGASVLLLALLRGSAGTSRRGGHRLAGPCPQSATLVI